MREQYFRATGRAIDHKTSGNFGCWLIAYEALDLTNFRAV
jgi:hypothetical protein